MSDQEIERFWSYVIKGPGCWLWIGALGADGYGIFHVPGTTSETIRAHRLSFYLAHGVFPPAVLHRCDIASCVNPADLFAGTRRDNNHDMVAKGRAAWQVGTQRPLRGAAHPAARLSSADGHTIRQLALAGQTQRDIAQAIGVSQRTVNLVLRGLSYV